MTVQKTKLVELEMININYKSYFEGASFLTSSLVLSQTSLLSELSPQGMAVCTAVNVLTQTVARQWGLAAKVTGLLVGALWTSALAKPLTALTSFVITPLGVAKLAAVHITIQISIYAIPKLLGVFERSQTMRNTQTNEQIQKISNNQLGRYRASFEKEQEKTWDTLSLNLQASFNARLKKQELELLPFTSSTFDEDWTKEQMQILFEQGIARPEGCNVVPKLDFNHLNIAELNRAQFEWVHVYLMQNETSLTPQQCQLLGHAFFRLNLPLINDQFLVRLPLPPSADAVTEIQAKYYSELFATYPDYFDRLPRKQQELMNQIFTKAGTEPWEIEEPDSGRSMSTLAKVILVGFAVIVLGGVACQGAMYLAGNAQRMNPHTCETDTPFYQQLKDCEGDTKCVKKAFRQTHLKFHPDKASSELERERYAQISVNTNCLMGAFENDLYIA